MIRHCVFLNLEPGREAEHSRAMDLLAGLVAKADGMTGFAHGPNRDYEGKTPDRPCGFICTFADRAAHPACEGHPDHRVAGPLAVSICRGGAAGIVHHIEG